MVLVVVFYQVNIFDGYQKTSVFIFNCLILMVFFANAKAFDGYRIKSSVARWVGFF